MLLKKSYFIYALIVFKLFLVLSYIAYTNKDLIQGISKHKYPKCEIIHIGVVCTGYNNNVHFYTLLKSIYYFRTSSLHFHIIVDKENEKTVRTLFDTWEIAQVRVSYYNTNGTTFNRSPEDHNLGILKLAFPKIIPAELTNKIIVIDSDTIFAANLAELWNVFNNFNDRQFIGLPKINSNRTIIKNGFNANLILYHLERMQIVDRNNLWSKLVGEYRARSERTKESHQDILIEFFNMNLLDALYLMPCKWNIQGGVIASKNNRSHCYNDNNQTKIIPSSRLMDNHTFMEYNGNLLRNHIVGCFENEINNNTRALMRPVPKTCLAFPTSKKFKWRTLLFFRKFQYTPTEYDVTLVTQLSYNKLRILDEVARRWQGPMSLSFYVTDSELHKCIRYIDNSAIFQNRTNIAYHAIFKEGEHPPINVLRNTALNQVVTPYVFLNDIDLIPMQDLYFNVKQYISEVKSMNKTALIVPAFETTKNAKTIIPAIKQEILKMLDRKSILIMLFRWRREAHGPTNFKKWRYAKGPYQIKWAPKFEPYVVVEKNVTKYDERFFGYGWNKISHIMELEAQGYEFFVLPNAFAVHKFHSGGRDKKESINSKKYQMCLQSLKQDWALEIRKKYGRNFKI